MRPLLVLLMLAGSAIAASPTALFNGRDLTGWVQEGGFPSFRVEDGMLVTGGLGNHPNWVRTAREFRNFRLGFEYRLAQWAEAAVVLRAPSAGRPLKSGIAIMMAHDFHHEVTEYATGAVVGASKPLAALPASYGEWRRMEIELDADRLVVRIDDTVVQRLDLDAHPELRFRLKSGYIGFADMGFSYGIRNLTITEFEGEQPYQRLFDGHSLEGWTNRGGGTFAVREGVIHATGDGIHYAPGVFQNFELSVMVRSTNRANGGVFLRGSPESGQPRGFEIQIYTPPDAVYPTGSIYNRVRSRLPADLEGRWFLLQIFAAGPHCAVLVDGEMVARSGEIPAALQNAGRIGLQIHKVDSAVEYQELRVREISQEFFAVAAGAGSYRPSRAPFPR